MRNFLSLSTTIVIDLISATRHGPATYCALGFAIPFLLHYLATEGADRDLLHRVHGQERIDKAVKEFLYPPGTDPTRAGGDGHDDPMVAIAVEYMQLPVTSPRRQGLELRYGARRLKQTYERFEERRRKLKALDRKRVALSEALIEEITQP